MPSPTATATTTGSIPSREATRPEPHPQPKHTYGSQCRLAPVPQPEPEAFLQGIPPINAQFFYASPIPIDDPLSTSGSAAAAADGRTYRNASRPFSQGDNNALESAWLRLACQTDRNNHQHAVHDREPGSALLQANGKKLSAIAQTLAEQHQKLHATEGQQMDTIGICCPELPIHASNELRGAFCAVTRETLPMLDENKLVQEVMSRMRPVSSASVSHGATSTTGSTSASSVPIKIAVGSKGPVGLEHGFLADRNATPSSQRSLLLEGNDRLPERVRQSIVDDDGLSGKPFVRVDSPGPAKQSRNTSVADDGEALKDAPQGREPAKPLAEIDSWSPDNKHIDIPVGISRLHLVSLPLLQMKPLYWSPVNDIAVVLRATWFDRATMSPLEPALANQLEAGYRELRPWTETWKIEVKCAIDVGPLGEEKVAHQLWGDVKERSSKSGKADKKERPFRARISRDPFCAARCFRGEAAAEGTLEPVQGGVADDEEATALPPIYHNYQVIYKDATSAFLLKPSLQPSAYYNRRPLSKILKGVSVGTHVVRGFDRRAWDRIHVRTKQTTPKNVSSALAADNPEAGHGVMGCTGCEAEKKSQQVTDLVLVAHGVGQKLAERVESFHFTHAINDFRRSVNIELASDNVKSVLRDDQNGIMVLPVNWRHTVSFDDPDKVKDGDADHDPNRFGLKDIEPKSIPAVRNIISDVMFDIPFYMSPAHRPKMIQAFIQEANRVYRLWCANNPGFAERGRVHLIGHSLGSAMAVEILSKQPTSIPALDLSMPAPRTASFEFDTTSLFLLGSPAAFFLLLERGNLMPRRGRMKPGADPVDIVADDVVGELGTLGCLAVDNIYNILAREDPIAYLLNGTIDPTYSASLSTAYVPSTATSFFASVGQTMRGLVMGPSSAPSQKTADNEGEAHRPSTVRLPSQLEMEIHDFTREEIAERKAYLLNDNGQIDYYLRSGGGPLDVQYLNMLSAHTSYWTNHDLIRLLCVEIGRKPGRANTLVSMRAAKASKRLLPLPVSN